MSYMALARTWRPRTFSQLIGQEHINKPLINALTLQRLHHAYLFTGTRGVGKTSVARILAKALNCELGITATPCLQCSACLAIEQGRFIDLIEVDGASKTRVEDTRELLDNVQYAPTSGRFKIYLIDEVHMLSQHSFNALLKTLEEPPEHVKFILATTDPQKLPVTILSRCLQFNLKNVSTELIAKHLSHILENEERSYEEEALLILARSAQGSMRDALSLLDQAVINCNTTLLTADVKRLLGYTQQDYAIQLLSALAAQNASLLIALSQQIATEGGHYHYVLDELLNHIHQISLYQSLGDENPLIQPSAEIKKLATQFSAEDAQLFYQISLKGREEISLAPTLIIGFNMTLLRMLTFRPAPKAEAPVLVSSQNQLAPAKDICKVQESVKRDLAQERSISPEPSPAVIPTPEPVKEEQVNTAAALAPHTQQIITSCTTSNWAQIIPELKLTGLALNAVENAELVNKEDKTIILRVAKGHQSLFTPTSVTRIESALSNYYGSSIKITLQTDVNIQASPAQQKEKATQEKQQKAEIALDNDVVFQQLQQEFSAELIKNSIVPLKDDL